MAQRLKAEVRARILAAAAAEFLAHGYRGARQSAIAEGAKLSTGNLYRYFPGKDELFLAAVPRAKAATLLRLTRSRVRELDHRSDWRAATEAGSERAARLLAFWIEHRVAVAILLARAEGSPLGHVRPLLERHFRHAMQRRFARLTGLPAGEARGFVADGIFNGTLDMIAAILIRFEDPSAIRDAVGTFWSYQLAGLEALANLPARPNHPGKIR